MVKQQKTINTTGVRWLVDFGQRLELARGRMGLTQAELAGADLSKSFVSLLETARSYPSVETLTLLARRTSTSLATLLMSGDELRLDTALSVIALARQSVWNRPAWAGQISRVVEELVPDAPLWLKVEADIVRGIAATLRNRLAEAERLANEARTYAAKADYVPGQAHALALRGYVTLLRRQYPQSFGLLGEAVALYRQSGALRSEPGIKALIWLSTASINTGRMGYARRCCGRARTLASRLKLRVLEGHALWNLGYVARMEGDLPKAGRFLREAQAAFEESEDLVNLSEIQMNLSSLYREQGKLDQALAAVQQSIRIIEKVGNLRQRSDAHQDLASIQLQKGDLDRAEQAARQALQDATRVKDRKHRALSLSILGRIAAARREPDRAARYLREAARRLKALGMKDAWAEASRDLSIVLQGSTPEAEAAHYLMQALNPNALPAGPRQAAPVAAARPRARARRRR